jgi:hypothetical protein
MSANSTRQEMLLTKDEKAQPITAVWRNGGFGASYDSFVVKQTVVLLMNFSAKNPPPSQSPKPLAVILGDIDNATNSIYNIDIFIFL